MTATVATTATTATTATVGSRFVFMLALAATLALQATPTRAEDPPPGDVAAALARARSLLLQRDSRNGCKEYLHGGELSQGKSAPSWIGLAQCYLALGKIDEAVDLARMARSVASSPEERVEASQTLACARLEQPDAQAKAEAADLFKENLASQWGNRASAGYYLALRELHRDDEAAKFLRSLTEGERKYGAGIFSCAVQSPRLAGLMKDYLQAIDGNGATRPEIIHSVKPKVTYDARGHPGFSGTVILETIIDQEGKVQNVRVLQGQPFGLSERAIESVKKWTFKPATLAGKPVKVYYVVSINFEVTKDK